VTEKKKMIFFTTRSQKTNKSDVSFGFFEIDL